MVPDGRFIFGGGYELAQDVLDRVMDALDLETFFVCRDEEEGKELARRLMGKLGFQDTDIVFVEHLGPGARVRARAYVHRSGDHYRWLEVPAEEVSYE
ncbi:MAG TPA: hypothetical protein GX711_09320 [Clostridia bacterium]|nr:hypothetical protein [Clostridia bacterium]